MGRLLESSGGGWRRWSHNRVTVLNAVTLRAHQGFKRPTLCCEDFTIIMEKVLKEDKDFVFSADAHVRPFGNSGMPQEEATESGQFLKHRFLFFFKHTDTLYYLHLIFPVDQIIFNRGEKRETMITHRCHSADTLIHLPADKYIPR